MRKGESVCLAQTAARPRVTTALPRWRLDEAEARQGLRLWLFEMRTLGVSYFTRYFSHVCTAQYAHTCIAPV
jgi:hypothetical protein